MFNSKLLNRFESLANWSFDSFFSLSVDTNAKWFFARLLPKESISSATFLILSN